MSTKYNITSGWHYNTYCYQVAPIFDQYLLSQWSYRADTTRNRNNTLPHKRAR